MCNYPLESTNNYSNRFSFPERTVEILSEIQGIGFSHLLVYGDTGPTPQPFHQGRGRNNKGRILKLLGSLQCS